MTNENLLFATDVNILNGFQLQEESQDFYCERTGFLIIKNIKITQNQ